MPTALQIAQGRQIPLSAGILMALYAEAPLLGALDTRTSRTTKFQTLAMLALPSAQPFVNYNEGFTPVEGSLVLRDFDCSFIGGQIKANRTAARKWDAEHGATGYTWFDLQTMMVMKAQGIHLSKQIIQGTTNDAKGFPGMKQLTPYLSANVIAATASPATYLFARTVINAGGTTDNTASSAYAFIEGEMDVQLVIGDDVGGDAEMFRLSELVTSNEAPNSAEPTKKSLHDLQEFSGHIGLSVSGMNQTPNSVVPAQYSLRRIANLTGDSGKGLTDALMQKLKRSFGPNKLPSKFAMATRSGEQLAASRQAAAVMNFNMGAGNAAAMQFNTYPPPPDAWEGIPIIYDDQAISTTDALES